MYELISHSVEGWQIVGTFLVGLTLFARVAFGLAIIADASRRQNCRMHVAFVGPPMWGAVILGVGMLAVGLYWVMHYSANNSYYSAYVSVGNNSCGRIYYSGWGCSAGSCTDTTAAGDTYQSRCCK